MAWRAMEMVSVWDSSGWDSDALARLGSWVIYLILDGLHT